VIRTQDLTGRLWGLQGIGRGPTGTTRLAWSPQLAAAEAWFRREAHDARMQVERDPAGNLWAMPSSPPPWWGIGSHLDSVRCGGVYDGALGVAAAFEVARLTRAKVAVIAFADEEGARFNTPTFGSRALVGRLDVDDALARVDPDGVTLEEALRSAGVDPAGVVTAPEWLERLRGFLELHIDQSREVAEHGVPAGVVSALATRMRVRAEVRGHADHAGTTTMEDRRDALAAAARLVVEATEPAEPGLVSTATRIECSPNAFSTIPAEVTVWLDGRGPDEGTVAAWLARLGGRAEELPLPVSLNVEAHSHGVEFDPAIRAGLRAACETMGRPAPEVVCYAGHDAGILAERIPAGMLLVRNERGVSHAPEEDIAVSDAAWGAEALLRAVEALA
jgi:beta-ureidopropionase / N-carbamoyl-L-amino-acid hydrolase